MRTLEDQIRDLSRRAEDELPWIDAADVRSLAAGRSTDRQMTQRRRRWSASKPLGALALGSAVVILAVGIVPILMSGGGSGTPSDTTATTFPETTIETVPDSSQGLDVPLATVTTDVGSGSIAWDIYGPTTGATPPAMWPWPGMAYTATGYHVYVSCEQFRGPDDPVGPAT
jgi:hypothetical protein